MTVPSGILLPFARATRNFPSALDAVAKSITTGTSFEGIPTASGLVPNRRSFPPNAATAGSALHHIIEIKFILARLSIYSPNRPM